MCCVCCPRQLSPKSNGRVLRCFGRNRCEDGTLLLLVSSLTAVFLFPLFLAELCRAKRARRDLRGARADPCLQLSSSRCRCCCGCDCCCIFWRRTLCCYCCCSDFLRCGRPRRSRGDIEAEELQFTDSLRRQLCYRLAAAKANKDITAGDGDVDNGTAAYTSAPKVRFVCLSDTHMRHRDIAVPAGDVLVHTGDFTNHGSLEEVREFAAWFAAQPHPLKIVVPGNHDMIMDAAYWADYWSDWSGTGDAHADALLEFGSRGVRVLIDASLEIIVTRRRSSAGPTQADGVSDNGGVKTGHTAALSAGSEDNGSKDAAGVIRVFGSPWVTSYAGWRTAFNRSDEEMREHWQSTLIRPANGVRGGDGAGVRSVDLLLTHMPPYTVGDMEPSGKHCGCPHLLAGVRATAPAVHVFGHVHSDKGTGIVSSDGVANTRGQEANAEGSADGEMGLETHCINAASVCDYYWVGKRKAAVFDMVPIAVSSSSSSSSSQVRIMI